MKPTRITLKPADVALVIRADNSQEMFLPELDDEDDAPENVEMIAMLAYVLRDHELCDYVRVKWRAFAEVEVEGHA